MRLVAYAHWALDDLVRRIACPSSPNAWVITLTFGWPNFTSPSFLFPSLSASLSILSLRLYLWASAPMRRPCMETRTFPVSFRLEVESGQGCGPVWGQHASSAGDRGKTGVLVAPARSIGRSRGGLMGQSGIGIAGNSLLSWSCHLSALPVVTRVYLPPSPGAFGGVCQNAAPLWAPWWVGRGGDEVCYPTLYGYWWNFFRWMWKCWGVACTQFG